MKIIKKISLVFILIFMYVFVLKRNYIPKTIAVEGKEVNISEIQVVPVGEIVGIKLYTSGVLVVGTSSIEGKDGKIYKPFENTEIQEGDSIIAIDGNIINNTNELTNFINMNNGNEIQITYKSKDIEKNCTIKPILTPNNQYKIGLWVRDSAAGVGTITFYNESTQSFAGLGHAITDIDTGDIIQQSSGEIDNVNIISIIKGVANEPGKIQGAIRGNSVIGNIYKNTQFGIYGIVKNLSNLNIDLSKKMNIALRQEITLGDAKLLSNISGELKEYSVEIKKIYYNNYHDNKSMVIKIIDEELLDKTGGIIQGMSGSPIIQNGKLCGAITHVMISNSSVGYAVFADQMIGELYQ